MDTSESYANAWMKWFDIVEAGANPLSQRMIELAQINSDATLLDIGTGIGEPALSVASLPHFKGRVLAMDLDQKMIELARNRAQQQAVTNIEFVQSSIESLPFDAASLDTVLARWSLMFVDGLSGVLKKLARALRPDGRLVAATWDTAEKVPALTLAKTTAHQYLHLDGSPYGKGSPFSLSDPGFLKTAFAAAGFQDVSVEYFPVTYHYQSTQQYIQNRIELTGPLWATMESDPESTRSAIFDAIDKALSDHRVSDGSLKIENQALCVSGRIPQESVGLR